MRLAVLISICLVTLCATAQSKAANASARKAASSEKNALFNRLSDQFLKEQLAMNPASASEAGYHKYRGRDGKVVELDAVLDDFSPAAMKRQSAFFKSWKARFEKETPVSVLGP